MNFKARSSFFDQFFFNVEPLCSFEFLIRKQGKVSQSSQTSFFRSILPREDVEEWEESTELVLIGQETLFEPHFDIEKKLSKKHTFLSKEEEDSWLYCENILFLVRQPCFGTQLIFPQKK